MNNRTEKQVKTIYFRNILVIEPQYHIHTRLHLLIDHATPGLGTIRHCSKEPPQSLENQEHNAAEIMIVDGTDLVCMPGLFDMHVHLREPGQEYKETIETGTNAAANGGFTGVCCMPNTVPAIDNAPTLEYIQNRARTTLTEVYCCAAITLGREGKTLSPMIELMEHGALMFSDDGACVASAEMMHRAFQYVAPFDGLLSQHCEEHSLTEGFSMNEGAVSTVLGLKGYPRVAEEIIVARDIMLAAYNGNRRYHVSHLSTKGSVELVRAAKARGERVSCEVTPHHFVLTDEAVRHYDTNAKMNPPLRTQADIDAIVEGLRDGTIDCIATDHAPHALHEKETEFHLAANGITGLETSFGLAMTYLVHAGHCSLERLVELMAVNPRKILGLPPVRIEAGAAANLTIVAPNEEWTVDLTRSRSKSKNSPFGGMHLKGKPKFTLNRGQLWHCVL
jgi:dihydroorotase